MEKKRLSFDGEKKGRKREACNIYGGGKKEIREKGKVPCSRFIYISVLEKAENGRCCPGSSAQIIWGKSAHLALSFWVLPHSHLSWPTGGQQGAPGSVPHHS